MTGVLGGILFLLHLKFLLRSYHECIMTWRSRKREKYTRVPTYIPTEIHMPTVSKGECIKMDDIKSVLTNNYKLSCEHFNVATIAGTFSKNIC